MSNVKLYSTVLHILLEEATTVSAAGKSYMLSLGAEDSKMGVESKPLGSRDGKKPHLASSKGSFQDGIELLLHFLLICTGSKALI